MSCYGPLAAWYDQLTGDVPYEEFADFYEAEFRQDGGEFRLLLDLCCGTGTLTCMLSERGYEMIGVDSSVDMLIQAREKAAQQGQNILFLCQDASELDLYGTVDAAICSLDGMNYLPGEVLPELFDKLRLFVRPGGLVIFDIRPSDWLHSLDGEIFVDENEDVLCIWRADYDEDEGAIVYGMDIFTRKGKMWQRSSEEHLEYAHSEEQLRIVMGNAGFENIRFTSDCPHGDAGRVFVTAKRKEN